MKRGSRLLMGLIAAGITFVSLWSFTGKQNSAWNHKWHNRHHQCEMKNNNAADSLYSK